VVQDQQGRIFIRKGEDPENFPTGFRGESSGFHGLQGPDALFRLIFNDHIFFQEAQIEFSGGVISRGNSGDTGRKQMEFSPGLQMGSPSGLHPHGRIFAADSGGGPESPGKGEKTLIRVRRTIPCRPNHFHAGFRFQNQIVQSFPGPRNEKAAFAAKFLRTPFRCQVRNIQNPEGSAVPVFQKKLIFTDEPVGECRHGDNPEDFLPAKIQPEDAGVFCSWGGQQQSFVTRLQNLCKTRLWKAHDLNRSFPVDADDGKACIKRSVRCPHGFQHDDGTAVRRQHGTGDPCASSAPSGVRGRGPDEPLSRFRRPFSKSDGFAGGLLGEDLHVSGLLRFFFLFPAFKMDHIRRPLFRHQRKRQKYGQQD